MTTPREEAYYDLVDTFRALSLAASEQLRNTIPLDPEDWDANRRLGDQIIALLEHERDLYEGWYGPSESRDRALWLLTGKADYRERWNF
jgi:hypothetical protein